MQEQNYCKTRPLGGICGPPYIESDFLKDFILGAFVLFCGAFVGFFASGDTELFLEECEAKEEIIEEAPIKQEKQRSFWG